MIDLNTVAIEQQDADAKLLEEPLPFVDKDDQSEAKNDGEHAEDISAEVGEHDAPYLVPDAPELSLDFDSEGESGEEDLLK